MPDTRKPTFEAGLLSSSLANTFSMTVSLGYAVLWSAFMFLVYRAVRYKVIVKSVDNLPGMRVWFQPFSLLGFVLPTTRWNPAYIWFWVGRKTTYFNHTHEILSSVPFILGDNMYWVGSLDVLKQLLGNERNLMKPPEYLQPLLLWGENLVAANNETWRCHRRILGPAFSAETYDLLAREAANLYAEMAHSEDWDNAIEFVVEDVRITTKRFALLLIARCGFGLPMPWAENHVTGEMSFGEALTIVCSTAIARLVLPRWTYWLPISRIRKIDQAWTSLAKMMRTFPEKKKTEITSSNGDGDHAFSGDLFTQLVAAHCGSGKYGLNEEEVMGNMFALMFAGHETTAAALAAALGFLAIHQDEQQKAYDEITRTVPIGHPISVQSLHELQHVRACYFEAVRFYPPGFTLLRDTTEEVSVETTRPSKRTIVLPQGSRIGIDMVGAHHDPIEFPDPEKYIPARWYGVGDSNVTMFGYGPRRCPGFKFSQLESVRFLGMLLREWKIDVPLKEDESRQGYEERVMGKADVLGLAFGVGPIAVKFTRRA